MAHENPKQESVHNLDKALESSFRFRASPFADANLLIFSLTNLHLFQFYHHLLPFYLNHFIVHLCLFSSSQTSVKRSGYYPAAGQTCVTYDDVNRAIYEARQSLGGYVPNEIFELSSDLPKPPHIAVPSEILLRASQILAKRFALTREAILFGLPRVDTYRTTIREICPTFLQPVKCEISKYRTLTGMCNNLDYPSWGSARSAMVRYLPPQYYDGMWRVVNYECASFRLMIDARRKMSSRCCLLITPSTSLHTKIVVGKNKSLLAQASSYHICIKHTFFERTLFLSCFLLFIVLSTIKMLVPFSA